MANNQILFFFSAFFHVILSFYTLIFFLPSEEECRLSVDIFAIEVCEELRDGVKGYIGKKFVWVERERDSWTDGQMDRWTDVFLQYIYLYFLYIIYYN